MNYYFSGYPASVNKTIIGSGLFFVRDNWNDRGYVTSFHAFLVNDKDVTEIGIVNIGIRDENAKDTYQYLVGKGYSSRILSQFPDEVFLLGSLEYYSSLVKSYARYELESGLFPETNDIAFNEELFKSVEDEKVVRESFFRDQVWSQIENTYNQLNRVAHGGPKFENFDWSIEYASGDVEIRIRNNRESLLPTNSFVFIGNNGVGKTSLLKDIVVAAASNDRSPSTFLPGDELELISDSNNNVNVMKKIVNLVFVSFSTFDVFEDDFTKAFDDNPDTFKFVGSRIIKAPVGQEAFNSVMSAKESGYRCETDLEWAFYDVENIQLFHEIMKNFEWDDGLTSFVSEVENMGRSNYEDEERKRSELQEKAVLLSSGQKIIILIISNLIRYASENSVLLIDEPELYLHPPYALALVMSINEIAEKTNSLCLMTTHSAVTLQEIPSDNVYTIIESGDSKQLMHPKIETFGTNTQTINDEVFGLDIRSTGYYKLLQDIVEKKPEKINDLIKSGKLGRDALLYLNILRDDNDV